MNRAVIDISDLPSWKPFHDEIIELETLSVVVCQNMTIVSDVIMCDMDQRGDLRKTLCSECVGITYMVLSVREIYLQKMCTCNEHQSMRTKSEKLFDGVNPPSDRALEYLLTAASPERCDLPFHGLPVEVQNMILTHASSGPVESARIGCMLSLGTAFNWQIECRAMERLDARTSEPSPSLVGSRIWFDDKPSKLIYH